MVVSRPVQCKNHNECEVGQTRIILASGIKSGKITGHFKLSPAIFKLLHSSLRFLDLLTFFKNYASPQGYDQKLMLSCSTSHIITIWHHSYQRCRNHNSHYYHSLLEQIISVVEFHFSLQILENRHSKVIENLQQSIHRRRLQDRHIVNIHNVYHEISESKYLDTKEVINHHN